LIELDGVKAFILPFGLLCSLRICRGFNFGHRGEHQLEVRWDSSGIWEGFIPNVEKTTYKYRIHSSNDGLLPKS
jgi:1,4-alpha-glucan branching enzyme